MLDIGQDGTGLEANARFARDAAALMLQYYQNDYSPIAGNNYYNLTSNSATDLYNGNISCLSTDYYTTTPLLKSFRYDKLNRIKRMETASVSAGEWTIPTDNFSTEYRYDYNGNILSLQRKDANAQIMHHINYAYNTKNNRLQAITATGINSSSYSYDAIGNLIEDSGEDINIIWNAANKVKTVTTSNNNLSFSYSPTGQRQIKKTGDKTEYYLHDATGNIMCIYELNGNYLTVKERTIYGSKRIGVYRQRIRFGYSGIVGGVVIAPGSDLINILNPQPIISPDGRHYLEGSNRLQVIGANQRIVSNTTIPYSYKKGTEELKGFAPVMYSIPTFLDGTKTAGLRDYELTDHLSNVMAVISDRKLSVDTNSDTITDYYAPQMVSFTDYYPFGFPIAERSGNLSGYRFGFNGQESDNEVYGVKQSYTAEFWQYDTRLGRRWNVDPLGKPWESCYATFADNPIRFSDILGLDTIYKSYQGNEINKKSGGDDISIVLLPPIEVIPKHEKNPYRKGSSPYWAFEKNRYNPNLWNNKSHFSWTGRVKSPWMRDFDKAFGWMLPTALLAPFAGEGVVQITSDIVALAPLIKQAAKYTFFNIKYYGRYGLLKANGIYLTITSSDIYFLTLGYTNAIMTAPPVQLVGGGIVGFMTQPKDILSPDIYTGFYWFDMGLGMGTAISWYYYKTFEEFNNEKKSSK